MDENEPPASGILASVRRMVETSLSTVQNRIELFAFELEEEKLRLISTLLWVAAAVFFGVLAITLVVLTIVFLSPDTVKPYVLIGLSLVAIVLAIRAVSGLRHELKDKAPPLSDTVSELKKDIACLRSRD
jgi:uncharacterized membrane protein YqjE